MKEKLNRYARNITSQHGEDGILDYIISILGDQAIKSVCEFGAWDGIVASNAWDLWKNRGWKAVLIEGDPAKGKELAENTKGFDTAVFNKFIAAVGKDSLDDIFRTNGLDPKIGILSIDIDSFDYHVWKNMSHVDPQVVVIEHNQHIPPHIEYFDPEGFVYLKCSAKALEKLGAEKGYKLICCTLTNSLFVKNDLFDADKFPDMPVEWLFDYSGLATQLVFTGEDRNKYPLFAGKARSGPKGVLRTYYRLSSLFNSKQTYRKPPDAVVEQLRRAGMDI
ncbi:MAG: hypothetical protein OEV28_06300 [Nitrospirota bacterium]|nr:hypothetical protein [Nitrospirota bacterium]